MEKKPKNIFVKNAISPGFITESIRKHSDKTEIGAHNIFLGQIRADQMENKKVKAIEYSAYEEMALQQMHRIREEVFGKYPITCMHVHHSLGRVKVGEICLFVFTSSPHRKDAIEACEETVERIKKELPIWGREILEDESHQWKRNH
jgi:molybdopterin synthase catalytic subunit